MSNYLSTPVVMIPRKVILWGLVVLALSGAGYFPARWAYERLKVAEEVYVYLAVNVGPDGKPMPKNRAAQLDELLHLAPAPTPKTP